MTRNRFKGLVIILDGLGDRPCPELDGNTPLEFADTPALDQLAQSNQCGLMDPLLPGLPVDTHTGVGILFGLPPGVASCLCRGPIEAAGIGLDLHVGDLLFRANLATVEKHASDFHIKDRRAGRIRENVDSLCSALEDIDVGSDILASLHPATQHRCVLRLRGSHLSAQISDTDPGGKGIDQRILMSRANNSEDEIAQRTAAAVNRFTEISHAVLSSHPVNQKRIQGNQLPANGIITRGVGAHQNFNNILAYLNLKVAVIAGESTILGLANLFSFTTTTDSDFTALPDTDLDKKLAFAKTALATHDLVYLHIKATDTTAHDRNPRAKAEVINRFDTALGEMIWGEMSSAKINLEDTILGVCADHSTDSYRGEHNGDPVPVLIHNPLGRKDRVNRFNETDCATGALGRLTAQSFLTSVLDAMGCLSNYKASEMEYYRLTH
ncbi:alkaline phosphatase family protein [Candidatus Spongiihabitans sp.]|uniref:alkaline phosphatase family protein n=1 Tax=Candidatus Spongiihabitans sp. TaxID=3101308 RepID=UPI003C6FD6B0